jgi:hypothetical protein
MGFYAMPLVDIVGSKTGDGYLIYGTVFRIPRNLPTASSIEAISFLILAMVVPISLIIECLWCRTLHDSRQ